MSTSENTSLAECVRKSRERAAIRAAQKQNKPISYIDDDGCEVTAMPSGSAFYNASDWW